MSAADPAKLLLVDDRPENLVALEAVLSPLGQELVTATSGEEALLRLLNDDFAVILLDVQMPGLDGFQTADYIKQRERTRHIPIIFLTALSRENEHAVRGYTAGAVDYLVKPYDPTVLRSKVQVFIELDQKTRALQESESRFRTAFDAAPIGMGLANPQGRWLQVNRALCTLSGYSERELLARKIDDLTHPEDAEVDRRALERLLAGEAPTLQIEKRLVHATGDILEVTASVSLVRNAEGRAQHLIVQTEDVTERRRAERDRAERLRDRVARGEAEAIAETVRKLQIVTDAALANLRLEDLLAQLGQCIESVMNADLVVIALADEDRTLRVRTSRGLEGAAPFDVPIGRGHAGRIAAGRRAIVIDAVEGTDATDLLPHEKGLDSLLGVPLLSGGQLVGVLQVGARGQRRFSADEGSFFQLVADRVVLAVEHARRFEHERGMVEALQRSLLPDRLPTVPGIEMAARYMPGGRDMDVGGDWYDAIELGNGRIAVAMGDVVGHGLGAAALMGQLRNALRALVLEEHPPGSVLARLDRVVQSLGQGRMATVMLLLLEPDMSEIRYASAGHPPPLLVHADGHAEFLEEGRSLPLGVLPDEEFAEGAVELSSGSTIVLYTDGLVEERGVSIDKGLDRLRMAVEEKARPPEALCDHVVATLLDGRVADDDVAVLALSTLRLTSDTVRLEVPAEPRSLTALRRTIGRWLRDSGASEEEDHDIQLACGEAAANAIEHGYNFGKASFEVEATLSEGELSILVRDHGGWREPRPSDRGRGLDLMEALMDRVEVSSGEEGTTVTMRRRLRGRAPEGASLAPGPTSVSADPRSRRDP